MATPLYFVTGSISHNSTYSGPEQIPVRYILAQALAVEQVRERVKNVNPLSVFVARVRKCGLRTFARKSPSSEAITWPAALRLDFRAFFAVLAAI